MTGLTDVEMCRALAVLAPDKDFTVSLGQINWQSPGDPPTRDEIVAAFSDLQASEDRRGLDALCRLVLERTDWIVTRSVERGEALAQDVSDFREGVRSMVGNDLVDPLAPTWPAVPSSLVSSLGDLLP